MGYQECFVLLQADQSALALINLMRRKLHRIHNIECPGISTFTCSLSCTVYPQSEVYSVENGQELVLSLGNRREQVDLMNNPAASSEVSEIAGSDSLPLMISWRIGPI